MIHRIKSAVRRFPTVHRTIKSTTDRLQPVFDFTSQNFGPRRGRRFATARQYFRPNAVAGYIGWVGNSNLGDEALFDAFQQLFAHHTPIMYDRHPVELRMHRQLIKRNTPFFDFVALGGGTLFSYRPYYYQVDHAIRTGLPLITFGSGVEDPAFFQDPGVRREYESLLTDWGKLLRDQPFVLVRGPRTAAVLEQYGVTNVRVIGDPALTLCKPRPYKPTRRVGINVGCDGKMWGDQSTVNTAVVAAIRHLIDLGWEVDFIPMEPIDAIIGRSLAREVGSSRMRVARNVNTPQAALDRFAECEFAIGQRLHAVILASGMSVPTIALEYRPKVADFMESVGLMSLSLRTDAVTPERLIALVDDVIARRPQLSQQLTEKCDAFRQAQHDAAVTTIEYVKSFTPAR